mmetsp:Transcript_11550/g.24768  ORF Transcript_11550/g.24768 Transcript_11550/m.24768 type:complete len:97 (-) Transcript_11550:727-1017(-)
MLHKQSTESMTLRKLMPDVLWAVAQQSCSSSTFHIQSRAMLKCQWQAVGTSKSMQNHKDLLNRCVSSHMQSFRSNHAIDAANVVVMPVMPGVSMGN